MSKATPPAGALAQTVTDDAFLGGALHLLQPKTGYRASIDGILLAASVASNGCESLLDVGAGVGVVGLALARRLPDAQVTMIERDPHLAELARININRNNLVDRVRMVETDVTRPVRETLMSGSEAESFDQVVTNPPFHIEGRGTAASNPTKASSNAMPQGDLDRWVRFMAGMVRTGGTMTMIHRADALYSILDGLAGRFGGATVLPIHPRDGEPASRVVVRAVKDNRASLQLLPGLVLHNADHSFRPNVDAILRHGAALNLRAEPPQTGASMSFVRDRQ